MPLHARIHAELMDILERLTQEGKIHSPPTLAKAYASFRQQFGPEALRALSGEELLKRLLAPKALYPRTFRDSLHWVLTYQDAPINFGNIGGGANPRFFLLRYSGDEQTWLLGPKDHEQAISQDDAITVVVGYRDQLVRAVALADRLSAAGSDAEYRTFQDELRRVAPDVSATALGHKYLHMLFPERFDDYHNKRLSDFHLIRLLQLPVKGTAHFVNAGKFVAL
jgi:hypothetical protein